MKCKSGTILRKTHTRTTKTKKTVSIKAHCIKDRGLPGKGPELIKNLKKGKLSKYGYSSGESITSRQSSLKKAVKAYGSGSVIKKLNAVKVLQRNTNPKVSKIFGDDLIWVQKTF